MNELIKKLKNNEKPFGLLSKEEQKCLKKVGLKNCEMWFVDNWISYIDYYPYYAYRIKPDYQSKPETRDLPITLINNGRNYGAACGTINGIFYGVVCLHELPDMPNFAGFYYANKNGGLIYLHEEDVAPNMRTIESEGNGNTVIARFIVH